MAGEKCWSRVSGALAFMAEPSTRRTAAMFIWRARSHRRLGLSGCSLSRLTFRRISRRMSSRAGQIGWRCVALRFQTNLLRLAAWSFPAAGRATPAIRWQHCRNNMAMQNFICLWARICCFLSTSGATPVKSCACAGWPWPRGGHGGICLVGVVYPWRPAGRPQQPGHPLHSAPCAC